MVEFINNSSNLSLTIISIIGSGLISLLLIIVFRKRYKLTPMLIKSSSISSGEEKDINISFKGENVNTITSTLFVLKNSGNQTIRFTSIAPNNKIKISTNYGYKILKIELKDQSSPSNNVTVESVKSTECINYIVNFDYFKRREGCVIEILHTSPWSSDVKLSGDLMDGNNLEATKTKNHSDKSTRRYHSLLLLTLCLVAGYYYTRYITLASSVFINIGISLIVFSILIFAIYQVFSLNILSFPKNIKNKYEK